MNRAALVVDCAAWAVARDRFAAGAASGSARRRRAKPGNNPRKPTRGSMRRRRCLARRSIRSRKFGISVSDHSPETEGRPWSAHPVALMGDTEAEETRWLFLPSLRQ